MERLSFFKVIIFFCCRWISIICLSTVPRSFDVISLNYFLFGIEHIGHDNKVKSSNLLSNFIFLYKFVQAKKFSDESVWIFLDVKVVVLEYFSQKFVLSVMNCL
jgi:hypothetical protein